MNHQSCEHVAEDPGKIMAALLHDYLIPKANISRTINTASATSTISHNLAATTLSTPCDNPKQNQPTTTTFSPIKTSQHQRGKKKPQKPTKRA
jgi:hypothetical protein